MVSTVKIEVPSRATQAEIDALVNIPAGSSVYNTDTGKMNITELGGATPAWNEEVVSSTNEIVVQGITIPVASSASSNGNYLAYALQMFNDSVIKLGTFLFTAARGTEDTPTAIGTGDVVGNVFFAGLRGDLTYGSGASVSAQVDAPVTATSAPLKLSLISRNDDIGSQSYLECKSNGTVNVIATTDVTNFSSIKCQNLAATISSEMRLAPTGASLWLATGGTNQIATIDFDQIVNIKTAAFQINDVNPFNPTFTTIGYTSAVSTGSPAFTTPIAIAYGVKAAGTWTKVTGMSSLASNGNISFSDDTITVNETGFYEISLSSCSEVNVNAERISLYSIAVNATDADKALAELPTSASSSESDSSRWTNISLTTTRPLTATDTVKIFYAQLNEGGTQVNDVNIAVIRVNVRKLGRTTS